MSSHFVYNQNDTLGLNGTSPTSPVFTKRFVQEHNVVGDILQKYYSVFLMCFGTIGNGLTLAVLSRKTFRSSPIGIYLRWLALSDLTALYTGPVYFWAKAYFDFDMRDTSALSCRFHRWIAYTSVDMSAWILILMTVARLTSILYPLKTICTRIFSYISLFTTLATALLANLPMFIFYGKMKTYPNGAVKCRYFDEYKFFIKEVWQWIVLVKFGLLPVAILIVLNTILCIRVFRSSKEMNRMNNNSYTRHKSPERSSPSTFGHFIHRLSGRRLMKHLADPPRNLNISNTDITRLTTTGDMTASFLQSTEDIYRRSALNSRYASTEELKKELNETYGIGQDNITMKSNNEASKLTEKADNNRGNAIIRFAKYVFNTKIRNRKSKYSFPPSDVNDDTIVGSKSLKNPRPLSTASDGAVFQRSKSSSRSLCYDSRNSFHFVRDSVQYTKEKRKLATSNQEIEELVPCKNEENHSDDNNSLLKNQNNLCHDVKRPTPIFTISSAGGDSQNVPLSDLDISEEKSDVHCGVPSDTSEFEVCKQKCPDDDYSCEESDSETEDGIDSENIGLRTGKGSGTSEKFRGNKDQQQLNNSFDKCTLDVTDNLKAASIKLQHFSLNPDTEFSSNIPLETLNKRQSSESKDFQGDDAGSDSSRRSTGLLVNKSHAKLNDRASPGRTSPRLVSNGLATPKVTGSRYSLNAAVARGRTGIGKAKTRNLTATLLVINFVFIICNIPIVIYMTSRKYLFTDRSANSPGKTFELVSNFIMYTNNASNFIMYCLTGTRFRVELKAMMREALDIICGRRRKWSSGTMRR